MDFTALVFFGACGIGYPAFNAMQYIDVYIRKLPTGKITTFAGQSKYQIIVDSMEVAGEGALLKMLEDRRKKLRKIFFKLIRMF